MYKFEYVLVYLLAISSCCTTSVSLLESPFTGYTKEAANKTPNLSTQCLECLCDDYRGMGCDETELCGNDDTVSGRRDCDLLGISYEQWKADSQFIAGDNATNIDAFADCKRDKLCSARVIDGYMAKNLVDCNGDGEVNCIDYALIHFYGPKKCLLILFQGQRKNRFQQCLCDKGVPCTDKEKKSIRTLYGNVRKR